MTKALCYTCYKPWNSETRYDLVNPLLQRKKILAIFNRSVSLGYLSYICCQVLTVAAMWQFDTVRLKPLLFPLTTPTARWKHVRYTKRRNIENNYRLTNHGTMDRFARLAHLFIFLLSLYSNSNHNREGQNMGKNLVNIGSSSLSDVQCT